MAHPEIKAIFDQMASRYQADAAGDIDAVLQFCLSGEKDGDYHAIMKGPSCSVVEGKHASPTTTFNLAGADWIDLTQGKADGMSLFMQGKLSVEGDMGLAMRMNSLFKN